MQFNPYAIFDIQNDDEFNDWALKLFQYQYKNNLVYKQFVDYLLHFNYQKIASIDHYLKIPFLPIETFKKHTVTCFPVDSNTRFFESSGTTRQNLSRHYILDEQLYQLSILKSFERFYGHPEQYLFIFLLPDEKERPHSSLIYMARYLQSLSKFPESNFYWNDYNTVKNIINKHKNSDCKLFILGISYALIDFAEMDIQLHDSTIVMETGGMKGKREEWPKKIFHNYLKNKLGLSNIHSEYGMTELLSQAYAKKEGIFQTPNWMKILVRDIEDPLGTYNQNKQGLINIIDLANVYTCSFIATSDLGMIYNDGSFEIIGRSDFSDIRGCNLMYY